LTLPTSLRDEPIIFRKKIEDAHEVRLLSSVSLGLARVPMLANLQVSLTSPLKILNTKAMSNAATHDVNMSWAG
jgi:hypothetical protein